MGIKTSSQIKQIAETLYHLVLGDSKGDNCVFCSNELRNLIDSYSIPKHSALIVEPTEDNGRHSCEPKLGAVNYFSSIAYILTGDSDAFTSHLSHAMKINDSHPNSTMFANYEDAHNWSLTKLAEK